jgi:hypothetical protein
MIRILPEVVTGQAAQRLSSDGEGLLVGILHHLDNERDCLRSRSTDKSFQS